MSRTSILNDKELISRIAARCHIILKIVGEENIGKEEDTNFEEAVEELTDEITSLKQELDRFEEENDSLLSDINVALSDVYTTDHSTLAEAVTALITEYAECLEEAEDENDF